MEATVLEGVIEPVPRTAPPLPPAASDFDKDSPQSFEQLFLAIYPRLVSILRRMLGDCGRAEELANEAFLKLHTSVLPPPAKKNLPGWLYRTAMNLGIDDLRARSRHRRLEEQASRAQSSSSSHEDGLQQVLRAERQKRVRTVLARLKPESAQLLLLRATGHSYREIAAHLEIPGASVGTMLIRAEASFEKCYLELFAETDQEVS
jgi:RNA polymerase sigma-70 factor (ECF subfamily)